MHIRATVSIVKKICEDKKQLQECRKAFEEWIALGHIVSRYSNGGKIITITATDPKIKEIGHISEFHIPSHLLEDNVLRCEYFKKYERRFWDIVYAAKLRFGLHDPNIDENVFLKQVALSSNVLYQMSFTSLLNYLKQHDAEERPKKKCYLGDEAKRKKNLISAFKRYGVKDFEYHGGRLIGGLGHHRAFSVWNDHWLHEFRVK
jgi:hypothetical protein